MVQAQAHADGLAVIGGRLHVPSPGPVAWIRQDWRHPKAVPQLVLSRLSPEVDPSLVVGALDVEWLQAFCVEALGRRPSPCEGQAAILLPDALTWDSDAYSLVETTRLTLGEDMPNRAMMNLSLPFLAAWMRYAQDGYDRERPSPEMADLLRAAVSERRAPAPGRKGDYKHEALLSRAAASLARWDARAPEPSHRGLVPR